MLVIKKLYKKITNTTFHGLQIDNLQNCKNYVDPVIPKLSGACCTISL